jgi:hypothetical protein
MKSISIVLSLLVLKDKTLFIVPSKYSKRDILVKSTKFREKSEKKNIEIPQLVRLFDETYENKMFKMFKYDKQSITFDTSAYDNIWSSGILDTIIQEVGRHKVEYSFVIPKKDALNKVGINADIILAACDISASIKEEVIVIPASHGTTPGQTYKTPAGEMHVPGTSWDRKEKTKTHIFMKGMVRYIAWDYSENKLIGCGQFMIDRGVNTVNIKSNYTSLATSISSKIYNKFTFLKRK